MPENMPEIILNICIALFVVFVGWWVVKHPNRSKKHPGRIRMPKIIPIAGWLLAGVGAFMGLIAFTSPTAVLGMKISAVAMMVFGVLFLLMYRNFYVAPEAERVHFRTMFGNEQVIDYGRIASVKHYDMNNKPYVNITDKDGTKLDLNPSVYDLSPMFDYLKARKAAQASENES